MSFSYYLFKSNFRYLMCHLKPPNEFTRFNVNKTVHTGSVFCSKGSKSNKIEPGDNLHGNNDILEPFDLQTDKRRHQAQRSIIVQVQSEQSYTQLHDYCSKFGIIDNMFHYTTSNSTMHFILLEFRNKDTVEEVMKVCGHNDRSNIIPTQSRMLWFRANQKTKLERKSSKCSTPLINMTPPIARHDLLNKLENANDISEQISLLHSETKLDDLGVRLRYLTAHQLEATVAGLFPRARVFLFGSSVNGFGRQGCDLDLVLQLDHRTEEEDSKCRLMFHAKPSMNARSQTQRHIDGLADLVQWFLPGCIDVRRILLARVPIVKYRQEITDIECDLSLTNMTAVYMSELLYTFGCADWRLQPLVFIAKRWAAEVGLTNPSPGRWITNFSLTLLVIFYLQRSQVLPSLETLRQQAGKTDRRMSEDGVNCTFLRDISKLPSSNNFSTLHSLLFGFFEYYAAFDFNSQGISLGTGKPIRKRDHTALYIINPLEPHLNVSQNVSLEETERLKIEFRNAAWELESASEEIEPEHISEWGVLKLFRKNILIEKARQHDTSYFSSKRKSSRLVPVSKLFEEENDQQDKEKGSRKNTV